MYGSPLQINKSTGAHVSNNGQDAVHRHGQQLRAKRGERLRWTLGIRKEKE